jgi:SAM-dependent methyltransferase
MSALQRVLEPEWLDELRAADPRAQRARADLRRVNRLMGNARRIAAELARRLPARGALRVADLGAGDGELMLAVARHLRRPGIEAILVDRAPAVSSATLQSFGRLEWKATLAGEDALGFLARGPSFDAIVANLFLHHFDSDRLARLLALAAARAPLLVACEPRRSRSALQASRALWLIGCNDVTRHDASVSVRAGFSGDELSRLWPLASRWRLDERAAGAFSHLFVAKLQDAM